MSKNEKEQINAIEVTNENDSIAQGFLEILPDGYGFLRGEDFVSTPDDIYVSATQIKRFSLANGDHVQGLVRKNDGEKFRSLIFVGEVNYRSPEFLFKRTKFDSLVPIFPTSKLKLETKKDEYATRIIDLLSPIGKGQRAMVVAPPKVGKTTLIKKIANAIDKNNPECKVFILLIDERPEEVTDMKRSTNAKTIASTFDQRPEQHIKVAEMVLERAKRLVEYGEDVVILLDSITRLARAYNLVVPSSGKTLSGGFDPAALHRPKRFFGAARNIEDGRSLTIIATSLIETGSKMDEVIFEEFKGTGNMELVLNRALSEKRIFPPIDINKSGTRREDLLLSKDELTVANALRKKLNGKNVSEQTQNLISLLEKTKSNDEFVSKLN